MSITEAIPNLIVNKNKQLPSMINMKTNKSVGEISWKNTLNIVLSVLTLIYTAPVSHATVPAASQMTVTSGTATASSNSANTVLTVSTGSVNTVLSWSSFSDSITSVMSSSDSVVWTQPTTSSAVLNYISSGVPTQLTGGYSSNGKLFFLNPSGVLINGATITAQSFYVSTIPENTSYFGAFGNLQTFALPDAAREALGRADGGPVRGAPDDGDHRRHGPGLCGAFSGFRDRGARSCGGSGGEAP